LLAVRPWEPRAFRALRRDATDVAPAGPLAFPQLGATSPKDARRRGEA
jgi:hypothetical protein